MRLLRLLLSLLCIAFGVLVVALNGDVAKVDVLWAEFDMPLGLLLLAVLLLGAVMGGLAVLLSSLVPAKAAEPSDDDGAASGP